MADQSPEIIDYKKVFDKLFEYHKYIRELNVKNRGNIKYIVNFTNFYKIYNILIKYAMNLIKKEEIIGSLKRNQENKKKK